MKDRMLVIISVLGIFIYNVLYAFTVYINESHLSKLNSADSKSLFILIFNTACVFIIFIPLLKTLWNRMICKLYDVPKISYIESINIYCMLFVLGFVLRQHNFLLFVLRLFST